MRKRRKKKLIDTGVESAMRSNSGEKKKIKKLSKGIRGRGDEERRRRGKKKKTPLRAAHNFFFFLKRKSFESARLSTPGCRRPFLGPRAARGVGKGRPPFVSLRALLCDITHSTLFGVLVVVLLFFFFLFFGRAGRRARLSLFASGSRKKPLLSARFPSCADLL